MATMKNKVIWQEGLFALPQHFQQQQRHCEYLLTRRLDAQGDFFWGFTELSINTELLAQGKNNIDAWWISISTFAVLVITLLLLTFTGDALRDALDPRKQDL